MALTLSINLDDATFADLSSLVDAARSSGVAADTRVRLEGQTLTLTVEPTSPAPAPRPRRHDSQHTEPAPSTPQFDAGPLKDAVRQVLTDTILNNR